MITTATINLTFFREELGIELFKDDNKLLYFAEVDTDTPVASYTGNPVGFQRITVSKEIVQCLTPRDPMEKTSRHAMQLWSRSKKVWLHQDKTYDFFEERIPVITTEYMQLSLNDSPAALFGVYLFDHDQFIYDTVGKIGQYEICTTIQSFKDKRALYLSTNKGYAMPSKQLYLLDEKKFLSIPMPRQKNAVEHIDTFLYVCERYAVLRFDDNKDFLEFFIYHFDKKCFVDLPHPDAVILEIRCTTTHIVCRFQRDDNAWWQVFLAETMEIVPAKFSNGHVFIRFSGVYVQKESVAVLYESEDGEVLRTTL